MLGNIRKSHPILDRYARDEEGRVFIDIAAGTMRELYNDYDKTAPYHRKDLDHDLVDYIDHCVREIGRVPFRLRFYFTKKPEERDSQRLIASFRNYFQYMIDLELNMIRTMLRTSLSLFGLGMVLTVASVLLRQRIDQSSLWGSVLSEGLTVAAWVSVWESMAGLLLKWSPHRRAIKRYTRISEASITMVSEDDNRKE
ncbi:MAG: hypothetical protein JXR97_10285 [Planctomycetes bacterium]|nr:hypothetical protein [Planctomycetota bacterium]